MKNREVGIPEEGSKAGNMLLEDCATEPFPAFLEGLALTLSAPEETLSSALGAFLQPFHRMHRWEAVLGLVLSIGLHASLLLAAMLFAQTLPRPIPEPQFVLVSLEKAGPGGADGAEDGSGGLRGKGAAHDLSSDNSAAPAHEPEQPAVPEPPEPVITQWQPLEHPTSAPLSAKPVTRQPVRKVKRKVEKKREAAQVSAETPAAPTPAEPEASPGNETPKDAGQTAAGTPGAVNTASSGTGDGGGTSGGKGGSHHGLGTGAGEFTLKQVDRAPVVLRKVEPRFPEAARTMGLTGKVVAKLLVGSDGHVSRISILEASPHGIFEQDVLKALKQWEFKPGYYRNQAVATWVVLPINFRLSQ